MGGHGGHSGTPSIAEVGIGWFIFCVVGTVGSLTLYGLCLEYVTSGGRKLHEASFIFITTSIYSLTAYIARWIFNEKASDISKYNMLFLSLTSIASTYSSIRSLRYVIYPVQVLFKSCKPVPVMVFGTLLGKTYSWQKYLNVVVITTGVALFIGGGKSSYKSDGGSGAMFLGVVMLFISLCFDGATGAYEDKLMGQEHVGPFDLMYNIQFGKAFISFCVLIAINQLDELQQTLQNGGMFLVLLGLTGAIGQVFVFLTISKFGALNCALIGLGRKILSLILSFMAFGHVLNFTQWIGLMLSVMAMIFHFFEKGGGKKDSKDTPVIQDRKVADVEHQEFSPEAEPVESTELLSDEKLAVNATENEPKATSHESKSSVV